MLGKEVYRPGEQVASGVKRSDDVGEKLVYNLKLKIIKGRSVEPDSANVYICGNTEL